MTAGCSISAFLICQGRELYRPMLSDMGDAAERRQGEAQGVSTRAVYLVPDSNNFGEGK